MASRIRLAQVAQSGATNGQVARYNSTSGDWEPVTLTTTTYPYKAGSVVKATFSGNPKTATVTFATPFADANYSVSLTSLTTGNAGFGPVINSPQTAGGFTINMMVNNINSLVSVSWVAVKHGET